MGHGIEREGAAPAPAPPTETLRVQLRILRENRIHDGQLVFKLHGAEVAIRRLLEGAAAAGHAAIVGMQNRESVLRQQLVPEQIAAPGIGHSLRTRTAVRVHDERHGGGACVLRQQQSRIESGAVVRLDLELLWRAEMKGFERAGLPEDVALVRGQAEAQSGRLEAR